MTTSIQIDLKEVEQFAAELDMDVAQVAQVLRTEIMAQALRTVQRVKEDMPVDTGRAQASWGDSSSDGIWQVEDGGLTVVQGSNVEYVPRLNEGWSKQAPAGFIDTAAADADEELNARIADALEALLA